MKLLFVALKNTKNTFLYDKRVFILIIVCTAITTFGFTFFISYIAGYCQKYYCNEQQSVTITFDQQKEGTRIDKSIQKLNMDYVEDIYCKNFQEQRMQGEYHKDYTGRMLLGDMWKEKEEKNYVIVSELDLLGRGYQKTPIGSKYNYSGKDYVIKGVCSITEEDEIIVPIRYFIKNFSIDEVTIRFQKNREIEREKINRIFNTGNIKWNEPLTTFIQTSEFMTRLTQVSFIFVILLINVYMTSYYIVKKQRNKNRIYTICGANNLQIRKITTIQLTIQEIAGIVIGVICYLAMVYFVQIQDLLYRGGIVFYAGMIGVSILIHILFIVGLCFFYKRKRHDEILF